ncbi:MAG: amidohydrolase family protein [Dehalococcoidia bacterium]
MLITDAQVHLYEPNSAEHPWPTEEGRGTPPPRHPQSFTSPEMLGAMEAVGVDRAVIVPPVWAGEDNSPALEVAARHPGKFVVMGRLDPYDPASADRLEHWLEQPSMKGIRMSTRWGHTSTRMVDALDDPSLEWYWSACERLGIPLMLLTGAVPARLGPIAERHPNLTLIVDHLSTQRGETVEAAFASFEDLLGLASHPRVFVKVGNGPDRSREAFPFEDVHPYLRRVYDAFGARRMLWEADITQLTKNTYAECLRLWQEGLPFLSDDDREWILGGTAAAVLNWPEPT